MPVRVDQEDMTLCDFPTLDFDEIRRKKRECRD